MATRFYFDAVGVPAIAPAFQSGWEQTADAVRRIMTPIANASLQPEATVASAETSTSATFDVLLAQFVSPPIAAQTIAAGTITGQARFSESDLAANMTGAYFVLVHTAAGALRGALKAFVATATEFATSLTNRSVPASAATSAVTAQDGDVITLEIGYRAANTDATSFTGTLSYGRGAASDLAIEETDTTAINPWFELSNDIIFLPGGYGSFQDGWFSDSVEYTASTANAATTLTIPGRFGQRHAITGIEVKRSATAALAGSASLHVTTTNLPDGMSWVVGNAMVAGGTRTDVNLSLRSNPLVSLQPGVDTCLIMPAAGAAVLWNARVYYRYVPAI